MELSTKLRITANGAYTDGDYTKDLLTQTKEAGVKIKEVYGDKAYFRKPILTDVEESNANAYIPVSGGVYRIDESEYTYNKDSDEWQCSQGNTTVNKKYYKSKNKTRITEGYKYYFEMQQCKDALNTMNVQKKVQEKYLMLVLIQLNSTKYHNIKKLMN